MPYYCSTRITNIILQFFEGLWLILHRCKRLHSWIFEGLKDCICDPSTLQRITDKEKGGSILLWLMKLLQGKREWVKIWDLFLPVGRTGSTCSATLCTCTHANATSQTTMCPNLNPNQKNLKFKARNPNPFCKPANHPNRRRSVGLQKGLGFLDSSLHLTQYSEPALPAGRSCYL